MLLSLPRVEIHTETLTEVNHIYISCITEKLGESRSNIPLNYLQYLYKGLRL
jgi:hypothetical protein